MYQSSRGMIRIRWEPCPGGLNFPPKISLQVPHREVWDIFQHCFGQNHWSSDTIVLVSSVCQLRWRFPVFVQVSKSKILNYEGKTSRREEVYQSIYIYVICVVGPHILLTRSLLDKSYTYCWSLDYLQTSWKISQDSIVIQFNSQPLAAKSRNHYLEDHPRTCK